MTAATFTYTSFPPVADEGLSPSQVPQETFPQDGSSTPIEMAAAEITSEAGKETAPLDKDLIHLDPAMAELHLLPPTTPTNQRSRRATMPEPRTKARPQDVPISIFPFFKTANSR